MYGFIVSSASQFEDKDNIVLGQIKIIQKDGLRAFLDISLTNSTIISGDRNSSYKNMRGKVWLKLHRQNNLMLLVPLVYDEFDMLTPIEPRKKTLLLSIILVGY